MQIMKHLKTVVISVAMLAAASSLAIADSAPYKVAMLLPGKINDKGWNAAGYAGLMLIKSKLGADVAFTEDVGPADQEQAFRDYASQGYDCVLAMGGQYVDGAKAVAKDFPKIEFGLIGANYGDGSNISSFNARAEQVFFLGGAIAALVSKTHKIGYISGIEVDNPVRGLAGFKQGVKAVDPNATVQVVWTGDFEDVAKAKEAGLALIDQGFDVLQANSNAATFGVMQAAEAGKKIGIGGYGDYTFVAPSAVLTNIVPAMDNVVLHAGMLAKDGKLEGKYYLFGYEDFDIGGITPINEGMVGKDEAAKLTTQVEDFRHKMTTKEITVAGPPSN